jgi:hypothetical protein
MFDSYYEDELAAEYEAGRFKTKLSIPLALASVLARHRNKPASEKRRPRPQRREPVPMPIVVTRCNGCVIQVHASLRSF